MSTNIDVRKGAYLVVKMTGATLAHGVAETTAYDTFVMPVDGTLVSANAIANSYTAVSAGTDPTINVYKNGATGPLTKVPLATAAVAAAGTILDPKFKAGDLLTLVCTTGASTGAMELPTLVLLFEVEQPALA